jgi:hypothetical protein
LIRALLLGAARALFQLGVIVLVAGGLLVYGAYRLARAGVARDPGRPVREAGFTVLVSLAGLVRALGVAPPERPPEPPT